MRSFFIAGTDTDVGKTYVTNLIATALQKNEKPTAVFKPIATGCEVSGDPASNADIASLMQVNPGVPVELMNLWSFDSPIAPHIAAAQIGQSMDIKTLSTRMTDLFKKRAEFSPYEFAIVEGAGGWRLPLSTTETLDQWVVAEKLEVILVVGMKLGCINHALLTAEAILQSGGVLRGWVANSIESMSMYAENVESLKALMPVPCLGEIRPGQLEFAVEPLYS